MKRAIVVAAILAAFSAQAQTPQAVYTIQLSEQEIEAIIQMGNICLKTLGYDCAAAFDIRSKLIQAKQPKVSPGVVPETKIK